MQPVLAELLTSYDRPARYQPTESSRWLPATEIENAL
jgi:hypothetical protein